MSKKRGLSVEEKRSRLLEIFHDAGEVFVLKEIEKLGTKKGITPQTIKDILQSLVDDDLVHQEKIGAANYFWSFPSEAAVALENEKAKAESAVTSHRQQKHDLTERLANERTSREDSDARVEKQRQLERLRIDVASQRRELEASRDRDPQLLAQLREAATLSKASANRWLDNCFAVQSWCRTQFPGMDAEIKKLFVQNGIDDGVEYLD